MLLSYIIFTVFAILVVGFSRCHTYSVTVDSHLCHFTSQQTDPLFVTKF